MSLISSRIKGWREVEALACAAGAGALFVAWVAAHLAFRNDLHVANYAIYGILVVATTLVYGILSRRRNAHFSVLAKVDEISLAVGQLTAVSFVLFAYFTAVQDSAISRLFLFTYLPALLPVLIAVRRLTFKWLGPYVFSRRHKCSTLLVGGGEGARRAADWVRSKSNFGLELVGCLDQNASEHLAPSCGFQEQLASSLKSTSANVVLVSEFPPTGLDVHELQSTCDRHGARLLFGFDLGKGQVSRVSCYQDGGINLMAFRSEPLESPLNRLFKRALDVAIAVPVVLFILPPLAAVVWCMQQLQSPGPLLFTQLRIGKNGKTFRIFKFRTMHVGNPDEARQAVAGDQRVYSFGRLLRRLSLDEFPQFLNVLSGSMSIVGPRPHMELHDEHFATVANNYRLRTFIKPGITGLAQIRGFRGPTPCGHDVLGRTNSDLYYLENWSLGMDLAIIVRTFFHVFFNKAAV